MKRFNFGNIIVGITFILIGIGFLAQRIWPDLELTKYFFAAFPLALLIFGLKNLIFAPRNIVGGIILSFIGISILLNIFFDGINLWEFWPLIFVFIGLSIIFNNGEGKKTNQMSSESTDSINDFIMFWGLEKKIKSTDFQGGKISAVFGGAEIDLREVEVKDTATVEVDAIFGGIEVWVPDNINVVVNGTGVFGAFENKVNQKDDSKKTGKLIIKGSAVFGGVEVK